MDTPLRYGRYQLTKPLARGGMGIVYLASLQGPGGASKKVALKLVDPRLSRRPEFVQKFLDEMRVAMGLSHRNIVQTFDAGRQGDSYYLVMEWMSGGSLAELIVRRGPLPLESAIFVGREIASGLAYAHRHVHGQRAGVVHRDISPGNVLLSDEGDVKLSDFGVARSLGVAGPEMSEVVGGERVEGKLAYMAPEQARGELSTCSDVFALGATLYRAITASLLRSEPTLDHVQDKTPSVALLSEEQGIPAGLVALLHRALSMHPAERPSAAEMMAALDRELQLLGASTNPHARLQAYMDLDAQGDSPLDPSQPQRLEQAMLEMAMAVPSDGQSFSLFEQEHRRTFGSADTVKEQEHTGDLGQASLSRMPAAMRPRWLSLLIVGLVGVVAFAVGTLLFKRSGNSPSADSSGAAYESDGAVERARGADRARVSALDNGAQQVDTGRTSVALRLPDGGPALGKSPLKRADGGGHLGDLPGTRRHKPRGRRKNPRGWGRLHVNSAPWAKVYVDGRYAGDTPLQGLRLRAGRHRLRLVGSNGQKRSVRIRIVRNRSLRRSFRLDTP